jgi:AraC-like DNA-binding protein
MPAGGSSTFTDADGYQTSLQDMLDLLVLRPREFHANLTWVELSAIHLLRGSESSARLAYLRLPPQRVYFTFPTDRATVLICRGGEVRFGDLMFHGLGTRLHQRTTGPAQWGSISLTPEALMVFGRTIGGLDVSAPDVDQVLRPPTQNRQQLLRLHLQAARLAETHPDRIRHQEIIRSLEQDLALALITCLTEADVRDSQLDRRQEAEVCVRLETLLEVRPQRLLRSHEIASSIGVSDWKLRTSCTSQLGMTVNRYQRLRRLKLVRGELVRSRPAAVDAAQLTRSYGFANVQQFVAEYWDAYGEMPPIPPRRTDIC